METQRNTNMAAITALESQFSHICEVGGAPGLSLSVLIRGEVAYSKHFGFRDVNTQQAPDGDTTYFIGSLTKAMVTALVGIFVEEGKLEWTTRIASILPELEGTWDGRGSQITVVDLLSHRSGIARLDGLWLQRAGNILLSQSVGVRTWTSQPPVRDFRTDYLYNNFGYELVGRAIVKLSGKGLGENLKEKLFEPLGMSRTSTSDIPDNTNAAKAYFALDDASPSEVPIPTISDKTLMGPAGSVRSCTNDLTKFYRNFIHAANDQFARKATSTPGSPFKQLLRILRPHNQLTMISLREQSYALGWGRAELPAPLGAFNYNKYLVPAMPLVGQGAPSRVAVYHGGSMQGATSAVYLLPETETAVIALQNSTGICDPCDWISQLVIHTLSEADARGIDFEALATTAAKSGTMLAAKIEAALEERRKKDTKPLELKAYTGRYWNDIKSFHIDITVHDDDGGLYMRFQSMESETYKLRHYHDDSWVWNAPHNETAKQGRFQTRPWASYEVGFDCGAERSGAKSLQWKYDAELEAPGIFVLEEGSR
ncbi:beta-lactamase/transpeptidase-like protein [Mariannaea sp. PMI_226]|nr:beta-lactamase/transpeptidase-like protein [Mariannaea sp. PMI_226]